MANRTRDFPGFDGKAPGGGGAGLPGFIGFIAPGPSGGDKDPTFITV